MNDARLERGRKPLSSATAAITMGGGWRQHAVTAVGPYAATAVAVGTSMLAHTTPLQTGVLLAQGAAVSLLCGALRAGRERARGHTRGEAEARRAAEAARASAEEARLRLRGVFDSAVDLMVLVDDDLSIVDANRAALDFLEKRRDELVGAPSSRFVAPHDRASWMQRWPGGRAGPAFCFEVSLLAPCGAAHLFEVTAAPDIAPSIHLARLRDIDARRRSEQFARFLDEASDILAGSLDCEATLATVARVAVPGIADRAAVDLVDASGATRRIAVVHADPATEERERRPRTLGAGDDDRAGARVPASAPEICESLPDGRGIDGGDPEELATLRSLGFVSSLRVPLRVRGRVVGGISLASSDVRRRYRSRDLAFAKELAHRASAALENARTFHESQEANRAKDEFLATISHELRTPLNAILGWTTMLRRKPDVDAKKALDTIERNARAQMRLIEDVLDVSRAVTGKLKLEPTEVDLGGVLRASVEVVTPMAEAKAIALDVRVEGTDCRLCGDADRLQQAFWNVLQNAIKFTAKGGRVDARLTRSDSRVELVVADTGRGIRPDFLPFVFDRFRQADSSTTRAEGGLGLGLAITKHIVELHGGTVIARSRGEGHGSTFTIALPALSAELRPASSRPPRRSAKASSGVYLSPGGLSDKAQGLAGVRALVCDDDEDGRELLAAVLAAEGAVTLTAPNGSAALDAFRTFAPQVLVSDVGMPLIDGYELIREIRAMPEEEGGQIPAIALTAHAGGEDELKALVAGYQVYVTKPIDPGRLMQIIGNLVGRPLERKTESPGP
jgi:PAS domain S-box-containing protein